jgi:hypothetical protein
MERRTFFGRLLAGAAALVGVSIAAKADPRYDLVRGAKPWPIQIEPIAATQYTYNDDGTVTIKDIPASEFYSDQRHPETGERIYMDPEGGIPVTAEQLEAERLRDYDYYAGHKWLPHHLRQIEQQRLNRHMTALLDGIKIKRIV